MFYAGQQRGVAQWREWGRGEGYSFQGALLEGWQNGNPLEAQCLADIDRAAPSGVRGGPPQIVALLHRARTSSCCKGQPSTPPSAEAVSDFERLKAAARRRFRVMNRAFRCGLDETTPTGERSMHLLCNGLPLDAAENVMDMFEASALPSSWCAFFVFKASRQFLPDEWSARRQRYGLIADPAISGQDRPGEACTDDGGTVFRTSRAVDSAGR